MKKKLRLQKEVVSVLDKKKMNHLTKAGATANTCCSIVATMACPSQHNQCLSDVCLDPKTEVGCGGETGQCVSATGCATDMCPLTGHICETFNDACMFTNDCGDEG